MADTIRQLDIYGNEDPVLKKNEIMVELHMRDGSRKRVLSKKLTDHLSYRKENDRFWLTKTSSGVLITSSKTLKLLRELIQEPEFFDEPMSRERIADAVIRWGQKHRWP